MAGLQRKVDEVKNVMVDNIEQARPPLAAHACHLSRPVLAATSQPESWLCVSTCLVLPNACCCVRVCATLMWWWDHPRIAEDVTCWKGRRAFWPCQLSLKCGHNATWSMALTTKQVVHQSMQYV